MQNLPKVVRMLLVSLMVVPGLTIAPGPSCAPAAGPDSGRVLEAPPPAPGGAGDRAAGDDGSPTC
jgi:hypothetical protein